MTKTEYYYGMIEKYNKSIHGQTNDTIYLNENTYLSLHTKHKSESICDYENQLKQYREECKERNVQAPAYRCSVYQPPAWGANGAGTLRQSMQGLCRL